MEQPEHPRWTQQMPRCTHSRRSERAPWRARRAQRAQRASGPTHNAYVAIVTCYHAGLFSPLIIDILLSLSFSLSSRINSYSWMKLNRNGPFSM